MRRMARARSNGIELEYEVIGNPGDPALLLIMGLGAQLITWDDELALGKRVDLGGRRIITQNTARAIQPAGTATSGAAAQTPRKCASGTSLRSAGRGAGPGGSA